MESVEKWMEDNIKEDYSGDGPEYVAGCGYYGYGKGIGTGELTGIGNGARISYDYGIGYGVGDGVGYGESDGRGICVGKEGSIKSYNGMDIYMIDGVQTIIEHIKETFAKGYIIHSDFSVEACYIAKGQGHYAHGKNLREAKDALNEKTFRCLKRAAVVEKFLEVFEPDKLYPGTVFFKWHNYLTGSCLMGREAFVKDKGLDVNALYTVDEFISICEDAYRKGVIQLVKKQYAILREKNEKGESSC